MLAYDYPLLGVFWTMLWFALFFIWIWLLIVIFSDIFRSHDIGGFAKTLWVLFVIFLPFLGILFYLIFRGKSIQERQVRSAPPRNRSSGSTFKTWPADRDGLISWPTWPT